MCAEHKPTDPNLTLEVNNDRLENLLVRYSSEKNAENLNILISHLHACRVLMPANMNDKKQPIPCFIKNNSGNVFLPLYTSKKQIPQTPKSPVILNIPYVAVNKMAAGSEMKVDGIAINPFSNNLILKKELLQHIDEVDKQRAEAQKNAAGTVPGNGAAQPVPAGTQTVQPKVKEIKLSPQQYVVFERKQYEFRFLPKKLFDEGKAFIEQLSSQKEDYIDALYEESYQQKRMYPYLTEDFSVLAINASEQIQLIRVDMPNRDLEDGACRRVFIAWDQESETGRYFTIEKAGKGSVLAEVTSDWRHLNLGEAPVEGGEFQRILDLIEQKEEA
jgi:hypothetical protein